MSEDDQIAPGPDNPEPTPPDAQRNQPEAYDAPMTARRPRRRGAGASMLAGIARGFQFVFEPKKEEKAAIIQEADDPERSDDGTYSVKIDANKPENTVITFHPPEDATSPGGELE